MPGIRTIKPDFWTDDKILQISIPARLFFIGLWNYADDNGVLENKPLQLKARIFPNDDIDVNELISELIQIGLLVNYSVNGTNYIQVINFRKHQKIDRPRKSILPLPNQDTEEQQQGASADIRKNHLKSSEINCNQMKSTLERERERERDRDYSTCKALAINKPRSKREHDHHASADASASIRLAAQPDGSHADDEVRFGDNGKGNKTGKKTRKPSGTAIDYPREFLKFWDAYPRKVGKDAALRRWQALRKAGSLPDLAILLGALKWQKEQESWREDGGRYIPHPATWLNAGRWADEPPTIDEIEETNPDYLKKLADPNCPICHGEGWEPLRENGNHWFKPCLCTKENRDETTSKSRIGEMPRGRCPPDASYS